MGKRPADTVSTAVRLDRSSVEWLKKNEGGVAAGLKRGLNLLMDESLVDKSTRMLVEDVKVLARRVEEVAGARWHRDPKAFDAFTAAINQWLKEARPNDIPSSVVDDDDDPTTLGKTVAKMEFSKRMVKLSLPPSGAKGWKIPFGPSSAIYREGEK